PGPSYSSNFSDNLTRCRRRKHEIVVVSCGCARSRVRISFHANSHDGGGVATECGAIIVQSAPAYHIPLPNTLVTRIDHDDYCSTRVRVSYHGSLRRRSRPHI